MPVDQSGENILFVVGSGYVEAHIQIQYTGDPERFAWLVPVPAVPEFSVGSQRLFTNLLNSTVPTFSLTYSSDSCSTDEQTSSDSSGGCFVSSTSTDEGLAIADFGAGLDPPAMSEATDIVVEKESVGAFDVTVLEAQTAAEVTAWLDTNGFLQEPEAPPILQDYIDRGHVFVAVKLQPGAGVNEIHPLVIRYQGTEPCIPLKLTAVAATENMAIRAFFLGGQRMMPQTYRHVTVNAAQFDWSRLGSNYVSVVSNAVDEAGADGRAFVTEYAGSSSGVGRWGISDARWDADSFRTAAPETVIDLLAQQGLFCLPISLRPPPSLDPSLPPPELYCEASHPLVLPIVRRYLPAPAGMPESEFYSCLPCNSAQIDPTAWDANAFADELLERVIQPGRHGEEILAGSPYLTRLFTTISPHEMTEDPIFAVASSSAQPVSSQMSANQHSTCDGLSIIELTDGRSFVENSGGPTDMPYAETVEEFDSAGNGSLVADNRETIDDEIAQWNRSLGYPADSDGGCGCRTSNGAANAGHLVLGAGVCAALRRLRRRRRRHLSKALRTPL